MIIDIKQINIKNDYCGTVTSEDILNKVELNLELFS